MLRQLQDTNGSHLIRRRALECLGIAMIGDGLLAVIAPRRHVSLWLRGPRAWQDFMTPFLEHPGWTRCAGAAELAAGVLLASSQEPA